MIFKYFVCNQEMGVCQGMVIANSVSYDGAVFAKKSNGVSYDRDVFS